MQATEWSIKAAKKIHWTFQKPTKFLLGFLSENRFSAWSSEKLFHSLSTCLMTIWQSDLFKITGKKYNKKAYLEKENKRSTLCFWLNEKDKTVYNENISNKKSNHYLQKYDSGHWRTISRRLKKINTAPQLFQLLYICNSFKLIWNV